MHAYRHDISRREIFPSLLPSLKYPIQLGGQVQQVNLCPQVHALVLWILISLFCRTVFVKHNKMQWHGASLLPYAHRNVVST
jgi:hypothetical protein